MTLIDDLPGRIEASFIGALAGEDAAGTAAGTADLVGVAELAAACGCFDDADLRQRGLERPSRAGAAGLLLRALPFGLLSPLDRPRLRRDAYRCVAMAGADEGTAVTAVAAALLIADLLRFDLATPWCGSASRCSRTRRWRCSSVSAWSTPARRWTSRTQTPASLCSARSVPSPPRTPSMTCSPPLRGERRLRPALPGRWSARATALAAVAGVDRDHLPHADRALSVARRLAEAAVAALPVTSAVQPAADPRGRPRACQALTSKFMDATAAPATTRKIRILTAKVGLDGHDRGVKVISRALRDAGVEVIYTGLHQTPAMVVEAAIQEDVDGIGISLLSGAHMTLFPEIIRLLKERDAADIVVFGGGIIPDADVTALEKLGVDKVFTPGTSLDEAVSYVKERFGAGATA